MKKSSSLAAAVVPTTSSQEAVADSPSRDVINNKLKDHQDGVDAINLWMQEVNAFLIADDAPFGDIANLETQLKDSEALVQDVETLKSKLEEVESSGEYLLGLKVDGISDKIQDELTAVQAKWTEVTEMSRTQNLRLKGTLEKSRKVMAQLEDVNTFMTQLSKDSLLNDMMTTAVTKPTELSQRTFKLLHFKDKIEKKRTVVESLVVLMESPDLAHATLLLNDEVNKLQTQWKQLCEPVMESYKNMKIATTGT